MHMKKTDLLLLMFFNVLGFQIVYCAHKTNYTSALIEVTPTPTMIKTW